MSRTTINDSSTNSKCDQDLSNSFIKEEFTQIDHTNDQLQIGTIYEAEVKSTDKEIKVKKDFIEDFAFQGSVKSINNKNNLTDFRTRSILCDTDKHYSGKKTYECDICISRIYSWRSFSKSYEDAYKYKDILNAISVQKYSL